MSLKLIENLHEEIITLAEVLNTEVDRTIAKGDYDKLVELYRFRKTR